MAVLDFYALDEDLRSVFKFLYDETDIVVFEHSSEYDRDIRRFESLTALESAFHFGIDRALFQLWSPSIMRGPTIKRIELKIPGYSFRYTVNGAGLMQLYLDGLKEGTIYHTHYGHWNEAGARARSMFPADECDWMALRKMSGRIQRHIRSKMAVGKLYSRPILPTAFKSVQAGDSLFYSGKTHYADSTVVKAIAPKTSRK